MRILDELIQAALVLTGKNLLRRGTEVLNIGQQGRLRVEVLR
jgi:hypothetical protein